ncbi:hypothetical protein [Streptomyces siamensis]|uniref:hypothetical protein n=1 Tax=Streptomyces siamensis TaxID=1274986 RepID=UPI0031EC65CA
MNSSKPHPGPWQLAEADVSPGLAAPGRVTALDAGIRLLPRRPHNPYLRRLH